MQYMRAIAALLVVIHHARFKASIYSTNPLEWFHIGGAGVDLFFIISVDYWPHSHHYRGIITFCVHFIQNVLRSTLLHTKKTAIDCTEFLNNYFQSTS